MRSSIDQLQDIRIKEINLDGHRLLSYGIRLCLILSILTVLYLSILGTYGAWMTIITLVATLAVIFNLNLALRQKLIIVISVVVAISSLNYVGWRIQLINYQGWWIGIPLFVAEAFGALHSVGLQFTMWPKDIPELGYDANPHDMPIFIFIPTVNEGNDVVEPTIKGALLARDAYNAQHPNAEIKIIICNDGYVAGYDQWEDIEHLAKELGVICMTRQTPGGAKAGNIENARQQLGATGEALIVIFDADQIAHEDFLLKLVPPFADKTVGWVQSGQYYVNVENAVAKWAHDQQALFYRILCPGKSKRNAAFICGTNVMLRAETLDSIGGLPQDSITEDFAASIELHPHWRGVFVDGQLADGLGPMDLKSYFKQQRRWAMGTLSILKTHWQHVFLPRANGLNIEQRLQYSLACTHYLTGLRDFIYTVAPIFFMFTGIPAVRGSDLHSFILYFLPYYVATQTAFWFAAYQKTGLRGVIIGYASFPSLLQAIATIFIGKKMSFQVTSKQRVDNSNLGQIRFHIVMMILSISALIYGWLYGQDRSAILITSIWIIYQIGMFMAIIWLAIADNVKFTIPDLTKPFTYIQQLPFRVKASSFAFTGILIGLIGIYSYIVSLASPVDANIYLDDLAPSFGIHTPDIWVNDRADFLEDQYDFSFDLIGRTQSISDYFDGQWAQSVLEKNAIPVITLVFESPELSLQAVSLPAIANGYHDEALRRWAQAIARFEQPVYLSTLQYVDRNWSNTSAVSNGGIPADSSRAWLHVQSVFEEEGADNVLWVWAPVDLTDDEDFAPPIETFDFILVTITNYQGGDWRLPEDIFSDITQSYPDKPIIAYLSSHAENPTQSASYLVELSETLADFGTFHALIYYEGSPNSLDDVSEHENWSLVAHPLISDAALSLESTIHTLR